MLKRSLAGLIGALLALPVLAGQEPPKPIPPGTPVTVTVTPYTPPAPPVSINLKGRHGHVTPCRQGCVHTGGGTIDIQSPTADTVVITMYGVAVATGSPTGASTAALDFDLDQCFEVSYDDPKVKYAKVTIEGRVLGLLRSDSKGGTAEESGGCATVSAEPAEILTLCVPAHTVACGDNLSINDHEGTVEAPIAAGKYHLHQCWHIAAHHPKSILPCKAASAEFDPAALDPLWISYWEPFHGAAKKDFGFQITVKVADDTEAQTKAKEAAEKKEEPAKEGIPAPKPPDAKPEVKPDAKPEGK